MTADRYISPCQPPDGYARELLTILDEEAHEVGKRVCKALRFGLAEVQPGQPHDNAYRIGLEIGDFLEVVNRSMNAGIISADAIAEGQNHKAAQLAKFMQTAPQEGAPAGATHRHYKGGYYTVVGEARHSETGEPMVVYRSCQDGGLWVRPAIMFNEVLADGNRRFAPLI